MLKKTSNFFILHHKSIYRFLSAIGLLAFCTSSFATDLLQGQAQDLVDTINGEGKIFIYIVELIISIAVYMKTSNLTKFMGVIAIAIFINIALTFAGV